MFQCRLRRLDDAGIGPVVMSVPPRFFKGGFVMGIGLLEYVMQQSRVSSRSSIHDTELNQNVFKASAALKLKNRQRAEG